MRTFLTVFRAKTWTGGRKPPATVTMKHIVMNSPLSEEVAFPTISLLPFSVITLGGFWTVARPVSSRFRNWNTRQENWNTCPISPAVSAHHLTVYHSLEIMTIHSLRPNSKRQSIYHINDKNSCMGAAKKRPYTSTLTAKSKFFSNPSIPRYVVSGEGQFTCIRWEVQNIEIYLTASIVLTA